MPNPFEGTVDGTSEAVDSLCADYQRFMALDYETAIAEVECQNKISQAEKNAKTYPKTHSPQDIH